MLDIYTDMDWVMCSEWEDATSFDVNENDLPTPRKWKKWHGGLAHLAKFHDIQTTVVLCSLYVLITYKNYTWKMAAGAASTIALAWLADKNNSKCHVWKLLLQFFWVCQRFKIT